VVTDPHEKAMQRALLQWKNPKNADLVREALRKAGREDLIGNDKKCLIRPKAGQRPPMATHRGKPQSRPSRSRSFGKEYAPKKRR
ncbi:MAG: DUF3362 domain-containing protein, partial [Clostridia bacterium]|nr:DUF3362 domain-containing protein [Clostridia bacterium]